MIDGGSRDAIEMNSNLHYMTGAIEAHYRKHRVRWEHFYPSERQVLSLLPLDPAYRVLDVGCGCGGLGLALRERFDIKDYTGVEINPQAAAAAKELYPEACFLAADILDVPAEELEPNGFDLVVSLSCIDWNVEFDRMLAACWRFVRPGGFFLASFRVVSGETITDVGRSYQYLQFGELPNFPSDEIAPYVVLNAKDLMQRLYCCNPAGIGGYGYWGSPSETARTPYETVCFAVLALRKKEQATDVWDGKLDLPSDILQAMRG